VIPESDHNEHAKGCSLRHIPYVFASCGCRHRAGAVPLTCTRCGKRLSKKRARMIDGKVLCSPCVFASHAKPGFLRDLRTREEQP
jgi:hypothetical protein